MVIKRTHATIISRIRPALYRIERAVQGTWSWSRDAGTVGRFAGPLDRFAGGMLARGIHVEMVETEAFVSVQRCTASRERGRTPRAHYRTNVINFSSCQGKLFEIRSRFVDKPRSGETR